LDIETDIDAAADSAAKTLGHAFIRKHPHDAARALETLDSDEAAQILGILPPTVLLPVWTQLSPAASEVLLPLLPEPCIIELLSRMDPGLCAALLSRFKPAQYKRWLSLLPRALSRELKELLHYPDNTAGRLMQTRVIAFDRNTRVADALARLDRLGYTLVRHLFVTDGEQKLSGQVDIRKLVLAHGDQPLAVLATPVYAQVMVLDPHEDVIDKLQKYKISNLPVVDAYQHLVGIIYGADMIEVFKEDITADMQTMVGASPDERAMSGSWFAVRKRLPWLQINLLTAFLAATVVGFFESTIAQFTALAVLLPVAAGQAGNAGAQALAVTMRGLTLREITVRHWLRVCIKEAGTGLLNGIAVAITCGLAVYLWSKSLGLSLVIALAMIISMTIAGIAGALVPILLKKIGQDPAQSSSIILTTVTDIAGFLSFLGIATLMASMLEMP
jgi:magnesium transporter